MKNEPFQGAFSGTEAANKKDAFKKILDHEKRREQEMRSQWAFLTGLQKTWIKNYINGATGEEPYYGNIGANCFCMKYCRITEKVVSAEGRGELPQDFDARALLEWATGAGLTFTPEGLATWERLNSTKQANAEPDKAGKGADGELAARLGVTSWGEIEASLDASGTKFTFCKIGTQGRLDISFIKLGFRRTGEGYKLLCELAQSANKGVPVKPSSYADDPTAAHRNHIKRLNEKFCKAFGLSENLFMNAGRVTVSKFGLFYMRTPKATR